jgi:hypothetical protein
MKALDAYRTHVPAAAGALSFSNPLPRTMRAPCCIAAMSGSAPTGDAVVLES